MFLNKKAHYNLIHFNLMESATPLKPWQKLDFRELNTKSLVESLKQHAIPIKSVEQFEEMATQFESPEEMAEDFAKKHKLKEPDHSFLIIFELWRRLLPEKRTVSTFCDELDRQIGRFEEGAADEQTQDILEYFKQILDDNVDAGYHPIDVFTTLQSSCGHNLEAFLYDYTLGKIEQNDIDYSADLIEGFYPYVPDPLWFEYLAARLEIAAGEKEMGLKRIASLIKQIKEIDLALEVMFYLVEVHSAYFEDLAKNALGLLENEEDFIEYLSCCMHYYGQQEFETIMKERGQKKADTPLRKNDKDLSLVKKLLNLD